MQRLWSKIYTTDDFAHAYCLFPARGSRIVSAINCNHKLLHDLHVVSPCWCSHWPHLLDVSGCFQCHQSQQIDVNNTIDSDGNQFQKVNIQTFSKAKLRLQFK